MDPPEPVATPERPIRPAYLAGLFGVVVLLLSPTLLGFHAIWIAQPYTHGYLIAVSCAWLA